MAVLVLEEDASHIEVAASPAAGSPASPAAGSLRPRPLSPLRPAAYAHEPGSTEAGSPSPLTATSGTTRHSAPYHRGPSGRPRPPLARRCVAWCLTCRWSPPACGVGAIFRAPPSFSSTASTEPAGTSLSLLSATSAWAWPLYRACKDVGAASPNRRSWGGGVSSSSLLALHPYRPAGRWSRWSRRPPEVLQGGYFSLAASNGCLWFATWSCASSAGPATTTSRAPGRSGPCGFGCRHTCGVCDGGRAGWG
jgi:hypothetical protein